jgi:uncharacterized membrane protein YfcA
MPRALLAFLTGLPVALLGGLIGLGGAEFRLPILTSLFGYAVRAAIPLNLAVSLVTLAASLPIRLRTTPLETLAPDLGPLLSLLAGSMLGAYLGTSLARRISDRLLEGVVFSLLLGIGLLLLGEAFFPFTTGGLGLPPLGELLVGVVIGIGIGIFSSLLGVAGGELLIPTLLLVFGLDIKLAGTGSVLISLPTVVTGILRWRAQGGYQDHGALSSVVTPMAAGSIVGALLGGVLLAYAPTAALKFGLGVILLLSAAKTLRDLRRGAKATV